MMDDRFREPPVGLGDEFFETEEFRLAFESQNIGKIFKLYRNHPRLLRIFGKPLSQELLGRWLGLTQAQVSRLENGRPEQNLDTLRNYATVLHMPRHMLWFDFPGERRFGDWSSSSRYGECAGGSGSGKGAVMELILRAAAESVKFGLRHEVFEINSASIEQISTEVRRLSDDFVTGDPFGTFMRSRQLRDDVFLLLERRSFPRHEVELYAFAARACGFLAAASSDFYGNYRAAADQCRIARRFADIAGIAELGSWALSLHSGIAFWQGELAEAATLAERAGELAVTRSGRLRAISMHARALARQGDLESLGSIVDSGDEVATDVRGEDENGMILFSDLNHLRCVGTANLWAGNSRQAREQLTRALRSYLSDSPDNFAIISTIRVDIAHSFLSDRDVEGAAEALAPLLELEVGRRMEGACRRMRDLRSLLESDYYAGSAVANDLSLRVEEFLAAARRAKPELKE